MSRLLDRTFLTEDEGYDLPGTIADQVKNSLHSIKLDSYNEQYVVRVTIDKIDQNRVDIHGDLNDE